MPLHCSPGYRWPVVTQSALASHASIDAGSPWSSGRLPGDRGFPAGLPALRQHPTAAGAAQLIRQRLSGQRFDPRCRIGKAALYRMLDAAPPRERVPFTGQEGAPAIALLLFVMRVDGFPPGLYLLPRTPAAASELPALLGAADTRFAPRCAVADFDPDCPTQPGLTQLSKLALSEVQSLARSLSCHQDIASTSTFSLGMLGDFATVTHGYAYRAVVREAGLIGQALYLEAEAAGVRGTGIGCFFDDPVLADFLAIHGFPADKLSELQADGRFTPLMRACRESRRDIVDELLTLGGDIAVRNADGCNALWLACYCGDHGIIQRLIDAGIDIDLQNGNGATCLMYVSSNSKPELVQRLLDNGADARLKNFDDLRALDLAGSIACLKLLRQVARAS